MMKVNKKKYHINNPCYIHTIPPGPGALGTGRYPLLRGAIECDDGIYLLDSSTYHGRARSPNVFAVVNLVLLN